MSKVTVNPNILIWAKDRSGLEDVEVEARFPKFSQWIKQESSPTLAELKKFANKTLTPFGYFFLEEQPDETLPIPNFRTVRDKPVRNPSPNLVATVQTMQQRQNWMREFLLEEGSLPLPYVGRFKTTSNVLEVATDIREVLGLSEDWAKHYDWWIDALTALRQKVDETGILIAKNGVVGNNPHRGLDVQEFRGFVLIDKFAPLIFVNGKDYEGAQMFTIAHELAHVWLGSGAIFNLFQLQPFDNEMERFCNRVAAEFLVPEREIRESWTDANKQNNPFQVLAKRFKVSPLVTARRALDIGVIRRDSFFAFYRQYREDQELKMLARREKEKAKNKKSGGNFYNNQNVRVGKRFFSAVYQAAKEGRLLYRDAFRLTGLYGNTFDQYSKRLGFNG
jgi:Zn-dependent peptidase ImmA (M78 family)